jgi:hypothetical protein
MSNIQLHVGYIGITREGKRVEIIDKSPHTEYPWNCGDTCYSDTGAYLQTATSKRDIIGPWVETLVEPQVNYNDGNWHRWDGTTAECPVNTLSNVEVNYIDGEGHTIIDERRASSLNWGSNYEPILAFRVTKEYVAPVEPREFWIELNNETFVCATHLTKEKLYNNTTLVHVREVI